MRLLKRCRFLPDRTRYGFDRTGYGLVFLGILIVIFISLPNRSDSHPAHAKPVKYPFVVGFERFYTDLDTPDHLAKGGMILLNELNCVACHQPPEHLKDKLTGRTGSRLQGVADRFDQIDLELMIRNPRFVKTDTIMPSLFSGPDRDPDEIEALKHYLSTLKLEQDLPKYPEGDIENGRLLYHKIGCVACHAPEVDFRPPWLPESVEMHTASLPSVPMNLSDRYPREVLIDLIKRPNHYRPAGRMPKFELTETEAIDIGTYLNSTPKPELPENLQEAMAEESGDFELDPILAKQGEQLFASKNCVACHEGVVEAKPIFSKPLVELAVAEPAGCLSPRPIGNGVPAYGLDILQRNAITEALRRINTPATEDKETEVDWTFSTRNCYACHERQNKGGPESAREVFFTITNPDAIPHGRWATHPPVLDYLGYKFTENAWSASVFEAKDRIRPYMTARMPVFRREDLTDTFSKLTELDSNNSKSKPFTLRDGDLERGKLLLGSSGQNCVTCHGLGGLAAADAVSVDLDTVTKRLTPEYFANFLRDPKHYYYDIPMPAYALDDQAVSDIWKYLENIDRTNLPSGLLRPDITELKPVDKPIVIRAAIQGYSEDALLVGFPNGNHFAFDVPSARWIGYWTGKFVDPGDDWRTSESVPLKPLGQWQPISQTIDKQITFSGYRLLSNGGLQIYLVKNNSSKKTLLLTEEGQVTEGSGNNSRIIKLIN